jgi:hypothetical protein
VTKADAKDRGTQIALRHAVQHARHDPPSLEGSRLCRIVRPSPAPPATYALAFLDMTLFARRSRLDALWGPRPGGSFLPHKATNDGQIHDLRIFVALCGRNVISRSEAARQTTPPEARTPLPEWAGYPGAVHGIRGMHSAAKWSRAYASDSARSASAVPACRSCAN